MNNADLVWHLIELLLQKDSDFNQAAIDKVENNKSNDHHQDET